MSTAIRDIENEVRVLLQDTYEPYRFSSFQVFCGIRDALKRLNSVRPESRYFGLALVRLDFPAVDVDMTPEVIETARDGLVLIDERWLEAIVFYALYKLYLIDSTDTANAALAANYLQMFEGIART